MEKGEQSRWCSPLPKITQSHQFLHLYVTGKKNETKLKFTTTFSLFLAVRKTHTHNTQICALEKRVI